MSCTIDPRWPGPWIFKAIFQNSHIWGMGGLIDMEWKGYESIWYWTHYMTLTFDLTQDLDLEFWRSSFETAISEKQVVWCTRRVHHGRSLERNLISNSIYDGDHPDVVHCSMKWKEYESIQCWTHYIWPWPTHSLNLRFSRSNFEIAVFRV